MNNQNDQEGLRVLCARLKRRHTEWDVDKNLASQGGHGQNEH